MASDLVFTVKAKTDSAAASFKKLAASILPVKKASDEASKSMEKINKTKVSPKVNTEQIKKLNAEIQRLQEEMRKRLEINPRANVRDLQSKINSIRTSIRELSRTQVTPKANLGPITRGVAALKGAFTRMGSALSQTRVGGFFGKVLSDIGTVGGAIGAIAGKFGSFAAGVGRVVGNIGVPVLGAALAAVTALGAGFVALGIHSLNLADQLERAKLQMDTFTHSTTVTSKLLAQVQQYADTTPFEFPELAQASKMLLGLGMSAEKVVPQLQKIGDIASQSGADVQTLTVIYQQMTSAGRLNAGDMMQLVNAGVNAWPILAKSMGKTVAQVRKLSEQGKIGSKDIQKFWDTLASGAAGATASLGGTLSGMISTLKDTVNGVLRDIGNALLPFAKTIVPQLTAGTKGLGEKIVGALPQVINMVAGALQGLLDLPGQILNGLAQVTQGFTGMVSGMQRSIADLVDGISAALVSLNPLLAVFGTAVDTSGLSKAATNLRTAADQTDKAGKNAFDNLTTAAGKADAAVGPLKDKIEQARQAAQRGIKFTIESRDLDNKINTAQAKIDQFTHYKNMAKLDADKRYWDAKINAAKRERDELINKRIQLQFNADSKPLLDKLRAANAGLNSLRGKKATPEIRAQAADFQRKKNQALHDLAVLSVKSAFPKLKADSREFRARVRETEGKLSQVDKRHATPKITVSSNAAQVAADTNAHLSAIPDQTVYIHVLTRGDTTSPSNIPGTSAGRSVSGAVAPAQVSLTVRDAKLADLIDIRVNSRAVRASRIINRRGALAL